MTGGEAPRVDFDLAKACLRAQRHHWFLLAESGPLRRYQWVSERQDVQDTDAAYS